MAKNTTTGVRFDDATREKLESMAAAAHVKAAVIIRWAVDHYIRACEAGGGIILPFADGGPLPPARPAVTAEAATGAVKPRPDIAAQAAPSAQPARRRAKS